MSYREFVYWCRTHQRETDSVDQNGKPCCASHHGGILAVCDVVYLFEPKQLADAMQQWTHKFMADNGRKGGMMSKRAITPEQQQKMQLAKMERNEKKENRQ
jgi:hypothetical protein